MKKKRSLQGLVWLLTLILVILSSLTGCTEEPATPTETATPTSSPSTAAIDTPVSSPTAAATATPTQVKIGCQINPLGLDPTSSLMPPMTVMYAHNIIEPLVGVNAAGEPTSGAGIASWEVLDGGRVIEFTLREGIKFHSGDPLTTADVVFSHERSMEKNLLYRLQTLNCTGVEVVDDYTCRFIFEKPEVIFLKDHLLYIASKSYYDRVGEDTFVTNPVGTGPYKFVKWEMGQYLDIEANVDYWGEAPSIQQARFIFAPEDTTRVAMLKAGEVDMITNVPYEMVADLQSDGYQTPMYPDTSCLVLRFQTLNPDVPWYDKRVRQAIAYAIDKESIIENLFHGVPNHYAWLAPGDLGYDPDLEPYPYDVAKAKELLAEAGYTEGFDMPVFYWTSTAGVKELAEAVTLYLKEIGINVKLTGVDPMQMGEKSRLVHSDTSAEFVDLGIVSLANNSDPIVSLRRTYLFNADSGVHNNPEINELIEEATVTFDDAARAEIIKQIFSLLNEDVPTVNLVFNQTVVGMKSNVEFSPMETSFLILNVQDISLK